MSILRAVNISPELVMPFAIREVDQHGEFLDAEIGMRFQPETIRILRIFQPEIGTGEIDPECCLEALNR